MKKRLSKGISLLMATLLTVGGMFFASEPLTAHAVDNTVDALTVELKVGDPLTTFASNIQGILDKCESGLTYTGIGYIRVNTEVCEKDEDYMLPVIHGAFLDDDIRPGEGSRAELEDFYLTSEELDAVAQAGFTEIKAKYNVTNVTYVEDGEGGRPYHLRALKPGTTTVVFKDLPVKNVQDEASTIDLSIPVRITEKTATPPSTGGSGTGTGSTGTGTENTITATGEGEVSLADNSGILPAGTKMTSQKLESGATFVAAMEVVDSKVTTKKQVAVFELNLSKSDDTEIHQLDGKVEITINAPFTPSAGYVIKVYRVDGDNLVECKSELNGDKLKFETDHFSTYVFVEEKASTVTKTGDTSMVTVLAVMAIMSLGAIFTLTKKKRA